MLSYKDAEKYLFGCDHFATLTPQDAGGLNLGSVTAPKATRRLYVGGAGAVKIDTQGGETAVVFSAVPAGTFLDLHATRVYATGTTAANILALW
jgi:hypothetical protein